MTDDTKGTPFGVDTPLFSAWEKLPRPPPLTMADIHKALVDMESRARAPFYVPIVNERGRIVGWRPYD